MGNEKLTTLARRLRPFFVAQLEASLAAQLDEGPDIDLVGTQIGRGGDTIITFSTAGSPVAEYAATSVGFAAALAASAPVIWLYGYTISGDHTIPAGYHVIGNQRDTSILTGKITMSAGATLTNVSVERTANDANALIGVSGPTTGTAYLYGCRIDVAQSGAGNAYAVAANNGYYLDQGNLWVALCELRGVSTGGSGYCGLSSAGYLYVRHGNSYEYSTDRFLVS